MGFHVICLSIFNKKQKKKQENIYKSKYVTTIKIPSGMPLICALSIKCVTKKYIFETLK